MSEDIKLKIGDVVLLKSGSQKMTVRKVFMESGRNFVNCIWFHDNKIFEENLEIELVKIHEGDRYL